MSMYAEYVKEKTFDSILETPNGFATYRYMLEQKAVYIVDIYVLPEFRKSKVASQIADAIVEEAKKKNCTKLLGSVVPSNKNSTVSLHVLLGYGMILESAAADFIVFRKDI